MLAHKGRIIQEEQEKDQRCRQESDSHHLDEHGNGYERGLGMRTTAPDVSSIKRYMR